MLAFLFILLFTIIEPASTYGHSRCSTSCGNLQIAYPFRLKGDSFECGKMNFELSCENNNTVLNLPSSSYYVTNISYGGVYFSTATLVDAKVAHSNCSLPTMPFPSEYFYKQYGLLLYSYKWITFMNCSERILDERYKLVPCLSRVNSSSFIYVIDADHSDRIGALQPKCLFSVKAPTDIHLDTHDNVLQLLREGFSVFWDQPLSSSLLDTIHECLHESENDSFFRKGFVGIFYFLSSPYRFELNFLRCLHDGRNSYTLYLLTFRLAIISVVLLDVILIIVVCRFVLALCLWVFLAYKISKLFAPIDMVERFLKNQEALSPQRYTYNEIISMTNNFEEKIGQGGFGSVFKGKLLGGYLVAVKMMGTTTGDGEDFISEVSTIGRIHHVNVVQLVGFCVEGSHIRALVYEYMANGSLDKCIFATSCSNRFLSMEKLFEIALSVARGLLYLHQGCNMRILHFDIKPHNILLDHNFTPKISDFGLAKLHPKGYSLAFISAARGTIGYMAPELISRSFGVVSHKSDVYSFGMLLMDIAGRRRHADMNMNNSSQVYYPSWIYDKLQKIEVRQKQGIQIYENIEIGNIERKLCKVGLWCIQTRPTDRPSMNKVVEMLESIDVNSLQMPPKPFFSTSDAIPSSNTCMNYSQSELSIVTENCESL